MKILKKSDTRWLSMSACYRRMLDLLPALRKYFQAELDTLNETFKLSQDKVALRKDIMYILDVLMNPVTEMLFGFLSYILPMISNLNLEFQSEQPRIFSLYGRMEQVRSTIMKNFIKNEYVHDKTLHQKNGHRNPNYFLDDENVHAGLLVTSFLTINTDTVSEVKKKEFFVIVRNFYVTLLDEMFNRFPFSNEAKLFKNLSSLLPTNLKKERTLAHIAAFVPKNCNIDIMELDSELELLKEDRSLNFDDPILKFYKSVEGIKKASGDLAYPNTMKIIRFAFLVPHSTAAVERIFLVVTLNKTKTRNSLKSKTLCGILHGKNLLKISNSTCFSYLVPPSMLDRHNAKMYDGGERNHEPDNGLFNL